MFNALFEICDHKSRCRDRSLNARPLLGDNLRSHVNLHRSSGQGLVGVAAPSRPAYALQDPVQGLPVLCALEGDHLLTRTGIKIVTPGLHHCRALGDITSMVVAGADLVSLLMRELNLDVRMVETHLM